MKGAIEAHVAFSRISFEEGGHSWELVNGVPVCRADHVWIIHQPDFKMTDRWPYGLRQHRNWSKLRLENGRHKNGRDK